jgi:biopolymer transport protein ExbB
VIEHKRFAYADLSAVAGDVATRGLRQAQQRAFPLALVATLSPLLGLLGTVIGMIGAFDAVALAGSLGDASVMAGEISYALVTTAMGLIVAVPALAAYHLVKARTTSLATSLDQQASEMINGWHQQRMTWKRSNRDAPRPRPRDAARADASASAASGPAASSPAVGPAPPTSGGSDHA